MAYATLVTDDEDRFEGIDWDTREASVHMVTCVRQGTVRLVAFNGDAAPPAVLHVSRREARLLAGWLTRGAVVADGNRGLGADDPDTPGQVLGKLDGPKGSMLLGYVAPSAVHANITGIWDVGLELVAPPDKLSFAAEFPADQARHMGDLLAKAVQHLTDHAPRELVL